MARKSSKLVAGLGVGCLVAVALVLVGMGACGVWLYQRGQQFERAMEDPRARTEAVLDVLGADSLPDGYHAAVAFSVPFALRTAILSSRPLEAGEAEPDLGGRGFIYVDTLGWGMDEAALRDFFEGRTDDPSVLEDSGIDLEIEEIIDRGIIRGAAADLWYLAQRGGLEMDDYSGGGIVAAIFVDCPGDQRRRFGLWFVPDPAPEAPVERLDLAGTPADPVAIEAFMGSFSLCR